MASKTEQILRSALPDDEDIHAEYSRLIGLFKSAPRDKVSLARKLVSRAAFLAIAVDRMEKDISINGYEDEYQNGENQKGKKKSAAAELHVTYTKNLLAVMKQLNDMLEVPTSAKGSDPFESF